MESENRLSTSDRDSLRQIMFEKIGNKAFKRLDIAQTYRLLIVADHTSSDDRVDWAEINKAIIDRWSISGLLFIKEAAWKPLRPADQHS